MKLYKLTDKNGQTYNGRQWGEGIEHTASGKGELCGPGWLHAYTHPLLAVLLNPMHARIKDPLSWEADGDVGKEDHGLKVGCTRLKTLHTIPLPVITTEQRVRFGILCALKVYQDEEFAAWAEGWLSKADRSIRSAAAWVAEAAWAARAAARAAAAAARADAAADAAMADAAAWAKARAAWAAAEAAAWAAMVSGQQLDLIAIAEEACS